MEKRIFIVAIPKGWVVLSQKGERLLGIYGSPNQALELARPLAASQGAEIVIYPRQESFSDLRKQRRTNSTKRKNENLNAND